MIALEWGSLGVGRRLDRAICALFDKGSVGLNGWWGLIWQRRGRVNENVRVELICWWTDRDMRIEFLLDKIAHSGWIG